uniref:Uncharacterized protein n=1 Tax=Panagrolaimus sp. ES5 TaxID=591445 RepID=A0AC34FKH6_9BILA
MDANENLKRPIFGIFENKTKLKIGQLFDLRDECFLESSVLKTELSPAIRVFDEKSIKIEIFTRPVFAEFISCLSDDNLLTQKKVLKLREIDANTLELDEAFIAKSQFAVTEIEMGQWILVSVSSKNDEIKDIASDLEVGNLK